VKRLVRHIKKERGKKKEKRSAGRQQDRSRKTIFINLFVRLIFLRTLVSHTSTRKRVEQRNLAAKSDVGLYSWERKQFFSFPLDGDTSHSDAPVSPATGMRSLWCIYPTPDRNMLPSVGHPFRKCTVNSTSRLIPARVCCNSHYEK